MTQDELNAKLKELETQIQTLKKQEGELQSQALQLQEDFNQQQGLKAIGNEEQWTNQFVKITVTNNNKVINETPFITQIVAHCRNVKLEKWSILFNFNENFLEWDSCGVKLYTQKDFYIANLMQFNISIQKITQQQYENLINQHKQYLNNIEQL